MGMFIVSLVIGAVVVVALMVGLAAAIVHQHHADQHHIGFAATMRRAGLDWDEHTLNLTAADVPAERPTAAAHRR